jgi:hypothetical protein
MTFSTLGIGKILAQPLDRVAAECGHCFPHGRRGSTLVIVGDLSGSNKGQLYETYSFLVLDIDQNNEWQLVQRHFRRAVLQSRRMSFKALNDTRRRAAIVPFLQAANRINGWLVTFAISKKGGSLFVEDDFLHLEIWKSKVRERLSRVVQLSGYLVSGLACQDQDVCWIIDEDEIASNADQLTRLTVHIANVISHLITFDLRHLRCATTRSDNGDYMLEDMCAICDLAAGATAEGLAVMARENWRVGSKVAAPLPSSLSSKSRLILSWLATESRLRRATVQIDLDIAGPGLTSRVLSWHAFPGIIDVAGSA